MRPDNNASKLIRRVAAKEIGLFFSSPIAWLFLATFAAVTLFIFFWGEAFFARNIADVRPLFEWMPILLIFLASTLTMRLWSEERKSGTLEYVLTQPVALWQFVLGKFAGCLVLVLIALAITLPLPVTVALLGELDWGPVWAGYLATFLLGAAYLSIGLFVSARSDNQIVSLISAVALCGLFYVVGTPLITNFFGTDAGELLRQLGTGARFDAITRGVVDLRDLYYYLSIIAVFLALNTYSLERERWSARGDSRYHGRWRSITALLIANAVGANLWLGQITALRVDATEGNQYSISDATEGYLDQLQEPLLLRGYFSAKTHPLLAPLVPQLRDLMEEYAIAGEGRVQVEFVDPVEEPELEEEANQQYAIEPVPFQVADRYQSSIVSSYFNVLVKYGDDYQVLGFQDLIEVKSGASGTEIDVQLRNPEHDLTRAIRTVLNNYQAGGKLFDTVKADLAFNAYVSADDALPEQLRDFRQTVADAVQKVADESGGRLSVNFVDPEAEDGAVARQLTADYGFRPLATSLFSDESFWFYLTLGDGTQVVQIPLDDMTAATFERNLEAGIKRFASGFTRTVAVVAPQAGGNPAMPFAAPHTGMFNELREFLGSELNLVDEDLGDGSVSGNADLLLLLAPENLDEKAVFAVDQFLMQGGTVIAATSPYRANLAGDSLSLQPVTSGLEDWLAHHGLTIEDKLVLDRQNAAFPLPVTRNVGGFMLREWRMLDYPWFVDVRGDGLNAEHPTTSTLPQMTLAWPSPITVDAGKNQGRDVTTLLQSSPKAWLSDSTDVMPALNPDGSTAIFEADGEQAVQKLGVISAGSFTSYFADRESPLLAEARSAAADAADGDAAEEVSDDAGAIGADEGDAFAANADEAQGLAMPESANADEARVYSSVIAKSPESARIILLASNDFLNDQILQLLGTANEGDYLNPLQFVANNVDWALDDSGLLAIRSRGHFNRTLPPLEQGEQMVWEYGNYALAAIALGVVALWQRRRLHAKQKAWARYAMNEYATN
ncbi:MAG: Gldg family protein [Gammaproteobacteria bacterium]